MPEPPKRPPLAEAMRYAQVGTMLIAPMIVLGAIGYMLDGRFATEPWLLLAGLILGMATGFSDVKFREKAGTAGEYVMDAFVYHDSLPIEKNKEFVKAFEAKFKRPPDVHNVWGYVDMYVIADALERAGNTDPKALQAALKKTDMMTPGGPVKFGEDGQNHEYKGIVIQWLKGKAQVVWPKDRATAELVYPMPKWEDR